MKILVFAPHNDDEVLGVGGTIAKYIEEGNEVYVCEVTCSTNEKSKEISQSQALRVHKHMGIAKTIFLNYPVVELNHVATRPYTEALAKVVQDIKPEIVFIPFYGDMHTDHYMVATGAMVALRPLAAPFVKTVLAYETLSETGWNFPIVDKAFIPNVYVDISNHINDKVAAMELYATQLMESPHPRSIDGLKALSKYRGGTIGVEYAEAFMCIRQKL